MEEPKKDYIIPQRVVLALLTLLGIVNAYTMRICLSVAIVDLVPKKNHDREGVCQMTDEEKKYSHYGKYDWSEELQGLILSSFYFGYITTHIPGGYLADYFGGKWVFSVGILLTGLFTLLTPLAINMGGANALIALRVLMGIGEGTTFPAASVLIARWAPKKERAKLGSVILGAGPLGTILANTLSGYIIFYWSWEWVFYVFGTIALIWFIAFSLLCYSSPQTHPFIKPGERAYLEKEMGIYERRKIRVPWGAILSNPPVLVLILAQFGHDWGLFTMVTDLPKYLADVVGFSIKENGIYSSFPYLFMYVVAVLSGFLGDWLITKEIMTVSQERHTMTGIASFGPGIFVVAASYAGCNRNLTVILFTIAMATMGTYYAGMKLGPIDISPNYAGIVMALSNGIGALAGFLAPSFCGLMTPDATMLQWRTVFWVSFGVLGVTIIIYFIFASAEVQAFNDPDFQKEKKKSAEAAK